MPAVSAFLALATLGSGKCTNGENLAVSAKCGIYVTFTPAKKNTSYSGTVTIKDNAGNTTQTISLTGTGD